MTPQVQMEHRKESHWLYIITTKTKLESMYLTKWHANTLRAHPVEDGPSGLNQRTWHCSIKLLDCLRESFRSKNFPTELYPAAD